VFLFAGEHTSAFDGQCVTGAFDTGHEAALDAIQFVLDLSKCDFCQCWFDDVVFVGEETLCTSCGVKDLDRHKFCVCKQPDDGRE
jgi:hypothetical protein